MNAAPAPPTAAPPAPTAPSPIVGAVNAVAQAASSAISTVVNAAAGVANAASTNLNSNKKNNALSFNSLIPFGNSSPTPPATNNRGNNANTNWGNNTNTNRGNNTNPAENAPLNNLFSNKNNAKIPANNSVVGVQGAPPTFGNLSTKSLESPWIYPLGIFFTLVIVFLVVFSFFNEQIKQGYEYVTRSFQQSMGLHTQPPPPPPPPVYLPPPVDLTTPPVAPQTITPAEEVAMKQHSIVERILPSTASNEVFNVAQNKFTYYDAEPLCKALGAELATYEQVKNAWSKGADWCNYGWVKGQMAVYPTQEETYEKLQAGTEDQRRACGVVGINGGYFDNPDMLYGVNCFGKKPAQTAHDEQLLMDQGKIPKTPETLDVDRRTNQFKSEADSLFVRPFNDDKWSSK